ncbi:MAG: helix-turn-helix domain-containing protein [Ruminococcus sp.]|jgi:hypothetical protein
MRLNMWMIANCLAVLEPELYLKDYTPAVIKGVRLYAAEGYAYVCQRDNKVMCSFEEEYFLLSGISLEVAFGLIQDVFDVYDAWESKVTRWMQHMEYQKIVDSCHAFLRNPLVLLDANYKVMALSGQYGSDEVDGEWKYLKENGFSSIKVVKELRARSADSNLQRIRHPDAVLRIKLEAFGYVNVSQNIYFENVLCGRFVIMERSRAVNCGDIVLIKMLAEWLAPYMNKLNFSSRYMGGSSVFYSLLMEREADQRTLDMELCYYGWEADDEYKLLMLFYRDRKADGMLLRLLRSALLQAIPTCVAEIFDNRIIVIMNQSRQDTDQSTRKIQDIVAHNDACCYAGPEGEGILSLGKLYHQLTQMDDLLKGERTQKLFFEFQECAVAYILRESDPERKICAIYPPIRRCWLQGEDREGLEAMRVYLLNNQSIAETAKKLYLHRNTLVYRLGKLKTKLKLDLQDPEQRLYYSVSFEMLHVYEKELDML